MKRIGPIVMAVLVVLTVGVGGCGNSTTTTSGETGTTPTTVEQVPTTVEQVPTLKLGLMQGTQAFPIMVMQNMGFEQKYGFKLDITKMADPAAINTAIMSHQVDAGFYTWEPYALQRSRGQDQVAVAPSNYYVNQILVKKDSKLQSISDLRGKKLANAYPPGGNTLVFRYAVLKELGFDPFKENAINQAAAPLGIAALERGDVDAIFLGEPNVTSLLVSGKYRSIWTVADAFKRLNEAMPLQLTIISNDASVKNNGEALKRFAKAFSEAKDILATDDSVWPELAKVVGINTEEGANALREALQKNYVQEWNKTFLDAEVARSYKMSASFMPTDFLPVEMPDGVFSYDIYQK